MAEVGPVPCEGLVVEKTCSYDLVDGAGSCPLKGSASILYWTLSFCLTSLCIMGSSFIHLIRTGSNEFF